MYMGQLTRKPVKFEIWILKWIFIPTLCLIGSYIFIVGKVETKQCKNACVASGYEFQSYGSKSRYITEKICSCLNVKNNDKETSGKYINIRF